MDETEDDIQWRKDVIVAIEQQQWEDAELLVLKRTNLIGDLVSRLFKERDDLIDDWRQQHQELPERDYIRQLMRMRRTTFRFVIGPFTSLYLPGLRRFLTKYEGILVKAAAVFLFAGAAAIAHRVVAARIEGAFSGVLRQYLALVMFIVAYKVFEMPFESALAKSLARLRRWGFHAEARGVYTDAIIARDWLGRLSKWKASLQSSSGENRDEAGRSALQSPVQWAHETQQALDAQKKVIPVLQSTFPDA